MPALGDRDHRAVRGRDQRRDPGALVSLAGEVREHCRRGSWASGGSGSGGPTVAANRGAGEDGAGDGQQERAPAGHQRWDLRLELDRARHVVRRAAESLHRTAG